jgi:hypothetical protein
MPPRVLLQDAVTLAFYRCPTTWTPCFDAALDFIDVSTALDYALGHGLKKVRVVLKFENPCQDVLLPLVRSRPIGK